MNFVITLLKTIWDVAGLSAQTLDFMQMLLSACEVHALYVVGFRSASVLVVPAGNILDFSTAIDSNEYSRCFGRS